MLLVAWLAGLVAIAVAALIASSRARAMPSDVVGRAAPLAAAIACAGLAGSAIWIWGGQLASEGRASRLRAGVPVRVTLRSITLPLSPDRTIAIGHSADDDISVPSGGELARVAIAGDRVIVQPAAGVALVGGDDVAAAFALGCMPGIGAFALPPGASAIAVACDEHGPTSALAIHRARDRGELALTPLGTHGALPHVTVHAGDVLRAGDDRTALPGVTNWPIAAARGAATVIAVPPNPTDCAAWQHAEAGTTGCDVAAGAFALTAVPILPDAAGVIARATRAAIALASPVIVLLVALALVAPSRRRARVLAAALRLAVLACVLVALACWRLAWAHRIDMLRELATAGSLVAQNTLAAAAIGATIAGLAAGVLATARRVVVALAVWAAWGAASCAIVGAVPHATVVELGVIAMSALAAIAPRVAWPRTTTPLGALVGLAAIAAAAIAARAVAPHFVLAKLGLAWLCVIAGHAALRAVLAPATPPALRFALPLALAAAVIALGRLDTGVTVAIAGSGLAIAMLVAGLDATYDAGAAGRLGVLEREHARLLTVHGAAAIALALAAAGWVLAADDRALVTSTTSWAMYLPLVAAVLYALTAIVASAAGPGMIVARAHRRAVVPWVAAALAATALFCARGPLIERATEGHSVAAERVSAVVSPGYALMRDARAFAATASAWREAMLPDGPAAGVAHGEGYFGARLVDPGVVKSIDNDYVAVLIARDAGACGVVQTLALLLVLVLAIAATASVRLRHASAEHRARWLVAAVAFVLLVYQPLAALGVLPLTGIGWPGLALDSPADLWLLVIGASWCLLGADHPASDAPFSADERVRKAPRLRRARALVLAAIAVGGVAAIALVARASASALARVAGDDDRIASALRYAGSLACPWTERDGANPSDVVPAALDGAPADADSLRFDRQLRAIWALDRPLLVAALPACHGTAGHWRLARDASGSCRAELAAGWPDVELEVTASPAWHAACRVTLPRDIDAALHARPVATHAPRVRVVGEALGVAAHDVGELVTGDAIVRMRPTAASVALPASGAAAHVALAPGVTLDADAKAVSLRGTAQLFVAGTAGWQRVDYAGAIALDHESLIVAGGRVVLLRPADAGRAASPQAMHRTAASPADAGRAASPQAMHRTAASPADAGRAASPQAMHRTAASPADAGRAASPQAMHRTAASPADAGRAASPQAMHRTIETLLADDVDRAGDRTRRLYPYGGALPELGWVNPYDVERSLGLDGWIHAALHHDPSGSRDRDPVSCGTLAPPPIARDRVCAIKDGVTECRVALQPELAAALRALVDRLASDSEPVTGHAVPPTRIGYVVLRGDTGELLAQTSIVPGREPLAYAPADAAAESTLMALRAQHGESDAERVDWNLPIAVGSTFKPVVARAAELAFPALVDQLTLTAAATPGGCRAHRGQRVDPLLGHCPPTSLADEPTTSDLHDFLARSLNWYQAALGLVGLALPDGQLVQDGATKSLAELAATDLASWSVKSPLVVRDAQGPILDEHRLWIDGLRRTPLWQRVEQLLGRPLCTLGDRASCRRAGERADVCAARALPIANASRDLRELVALGPDRLDFYGDDRPHQAAVPVREYFQLLRGSGVHSIGSLAQLADAFGRVVYDDSPGAPRLAASWFPAPAVGTLPTWSCARATGHAAKVRGDDGGLCAVVQPGGTAAGVFSNVLADPHVIVYGAKTGTTDSLADLAHDPILCEVWNRTHRPESALVCGKTPPDDSLFVIAFGVVTDDGTIPITLALQLQRGGKSAAARAAPSFIGAIAHYLRGE